MSLFVLSKKWLNISFRVHGLNRTGCDCIGLVIGVLYENGILNNTNVEKYKKIKYGNNLLKIDKEQMLNEILQYFNEVQDITRSDLLIVKCKNSPIHFIIYEKGRIPEKAKIIHVTKEVGHVFMSNFDKNLEIIGMFCLK